MVGVHRLNRVVTLAQWPVLQILDAASLRMRRDHRVVAMGSPLDRFADNAAYLFLYMSDQADEDIAPVWISGSPRVVRLLRTHGYAAELRWSWAGIRTCLKAGTYAYSGYRSDISRWFSSGATTLCLWHGIPLKRIEADVATSRLRSERPREIRGASQESAPDLLLSSTSQVTRDCFIHAFGVPEERCWELGYPRNDHLLTAPREPHPALLATTAELDRLKHADLVVGLFLTWRDGKAVDIVKPLLVDQLALICAQHGATLAYKAHYNVAPVDVDASRCVQLPRDADLHAYLGLCDILITDYSSIALDFLLLARPTIYFMPDLERYASKRGFYFDPLTLPGTIARDPASLLEGLRRLLTAPQQIIDGAGTAALRRRIWGDYDGHAGPAVARALRGDIQRRLALRQASS